MTHLSIDPGKNIGWALFTPEGEELGRGVMLFDLFSHSLHYKPSQYADRLVFMPRGAATPRSMYPVSKVTVESYYLDPGVPQGGSTGPAQEVVGVMKYLCNQAGITPVFQRSAILGVAMTHCGYEPPRTKTGNPKHLPDEDSAWLHGMERMIVEGTIRPPHDVSATL